MTRTDKKDKNGQERQQIEFVAEIGSNHNGRFRRLKALVVNACQVGFDSIKLQWIEEPGDIYRHPEHHKVTCLPSNFGLDELAEMVDWIHQQGKRFGCTVFNPAHLAKLEPFVDFWKVSSYDASRFDDLISPMVDTGKPVYISCGLVDPWSDNHRFKFLHCVSKYPCPHHEAGLERMASGLFNGYSDHTINIGVVTRAVYRYGAQIIELHFDVLGPENHGKRGAESGHSWYPEWAQTLMGIVHDGLDADFWNEGMASNPVEEKWMADPADGKRPLLKYEDELIRKKVGG